MHTLDEGIKGLGDIDAFFAYVRHVGATHHQVPGFKAENFWVSGNLLPKYRLYNEHYRKRNGYFKCIFYHKIVFGTFTIFSHVT